MVSTPVLDLTTSFRGDFQAYPLGAEGTEAKFWLSASNIGRGGGGGGGPGFPPPALYGHSNTSLPTRDMKQSMQTRGHMNHKKAWKLPHSMHIQLY